MNGIQRQTSIYLGGALGRRQRVPVRLDALEQRAREAMTPDAFAYVAAGAGAETTVAANRAAFDRWRIVPRMLRDVSARDTSIELFGRRHETPFLLAPIGVQELAHPEADVATARAAAAERVPMIFSNQASKPMEECAAAMGDAARWFQLYWSKSDDLVESLVERAEACGAGAIVVTLDTTMLGWRPRDLEPAQLPFLRGKGIAQYTSDPVFRRLLDEAPPEGSPADNAKPTLTAIRTLFTQARRHPEPFLNALRSGRARAAVQRFTEIYSRPSLTWDDLPFLRERTKLPILLKGILHPDDARRAVEGAGMDGLVVSNHGGRQVDGSIATLEALPGVVEAVGGRVPVLLDSGIRGGADAFKALALGADAILLGRPYIYGLAIAGEAGVREVLQNFKAEFDLTLGLAGCTSIAQVDRGTLVLSGSGPTAAAPPQA